jgi:UDP-3-O-[3-hydroxymyristoyl] glucosamine N-acyltransferase
MNFIETKLSTLLEQFGGRLASFGGDPAVADDIPLAGIQPLEKAGIPSFATNCSQQKRV